MIHSRRSFLQTAYRSIAGGAMMLLMPEKLLEAAMRNGTYLERAVYAMGTTVSVSLFGTDRGHLLSATDAAFAELQRLERLLSVYRPDSDIARLNRSAGTDGVVVGTDTLTVLSTAKEFHVRSGGVFDVTIEPLMERWGFRSDRKDEETQTEKPIIGDHHLHVLGDNTLQLDHDRVQVDTGGIAVGYAVDRMIDVLRKYDIDRALINHSGDVYALGAPEDAPGWQVVVPHPGDARETLMDVYLADRALSTSSNMSNTRQRSGRTMGHIFDPRTEANPTACMSMSVLAPTSCAADAMSTALFISGDTTCIQSGGYDHIALLHGERLDTSLR